MVSCHPCSTPFIIKKSKVIDDPHFYRSLVGALQYVTITRPDLTYAINTACQYIHRLCLSHFQALKRILHYLASTKNLSLHYKPSSLMIQGFSDTNGVSGLSDRKSTTDYCVYLGKNPILWTSKKQTTISRLTMEAEYHALLSITAEICWLSMLLQEIRLPIPGIPIIWCDRKSVIALASFPVFHACTKHIKIDYHFIKEKKYFKVFSQSTTFLRKPNRRIYSQSHYVYQNSRCFIPSLA